MLAAGVCVLLSGCIKNNIPYPQIQVGFQSMEAEWELQPASIDQQNRSVTLFLGENADISDVVIKSYELSPEARLVSPENISRLDLTNDVNVVVGLYQDYTWTITARQTIDRYLEVGNQIGATTIDVPGHRVIFSIPDNVDVQKVHVTSIKLGPEGSVMEPDLNGQDVDFSSPVKVDVTAYGRTSTWTLYADVVETTVFTTRADGWTRVAWVYGEAESGKDNGIEYRQADSESWIKVPASQLTFTGGSFVACIKGLEPMTEYVARAYSNEETGAELTFTTQQEAQMPNSSFEDWSLDGKVWQPWGEGQTEYWDTGNKGATVLGTANVLPTDETSTGTGKAALLKTEFKGLAGIGKLAAGSIFVGKYVRTDGTNGVLSFGRTFTQRPTKLRGALKYKTAPISDVTGGFEDMLGKPDTCIVWVALIDSTEPFECRTNPSNRQLFNPEAENVIAYGSVQYGHDVENYTEFEIELNYKSTSRIPSYILCVCSSSKYGDYFTGGRGSELCVDDISLLYDY